MSLNPVWFDNLVTQMTIYCLSPLCYPQYYLMQCRVTIDIEWLHWRMVLNLWSMIDWQVVIYHISQDMHTMVKVMTDEGAIIFTQNINYLCTWKNYPKRYRLCLDRISLSNRHMIFFIHLGICIREEVLPSCFTKYGFCRIVGVTRNGMVGK